MPGGTVHQIGKNSQPVVIPRNIGRSVRVEETQKRDFLACLAQFLCHCIGNPSAHGITRQVVWALGLERADLACIMCGHLFHHFVAFLPAVQIHGLHAIDRTLSLHHPGQIEKHINIPTISVEEEQRCLLPVLVKGDKRTPCRHPLFSLQHCGQLRDRRRSEKKSNG